MIRSLASVSRPTWLFAAAASASLSLVPSAQAQDTGVKVEDAPSTTPAPNTQTSAGIPPATNSEPSDGTNTRSQPVPGSAELEFRTGERDRLQVALRGGATYDFETDVDDSNGSFSVARTNFGLGLSYALSQRWLVNLDTDAELSFYDFSGFAGLTGPSDEPLDNVGELTIRPGLTYIHSPEWAFFGGGIIQFAGEFDVDLGDAATYGGFGGARWQPRPGMAFSFGLAAKSRFEDDALVFPLLGADWQIDETWSLGTTGLEGTLAAKLAERWSWLLTGGWRPREYRLDDDNDISNGVFQDDRVYVGTGVEFRPNPISSVRFLGGVTVWNEITFEDEHGLKVFEEQADPTGFIGIKGTLRF